MCVCFGGVVVSSGRFIYISLQGRVSLDVSSCGLFSVRSWPVKCVWVTSFHTISVLVVASLFFIASRHVMISTCGPPFGPHWCVAGVVSGGHDEYGDMVCPPAPTSSSTLSIWVATTKLLIAKWNVWGWRLLEILLLRDLLFQMVSVPHWCNAKPTH